MKKTVLNVMAAVLCGLAAAGSALAADGFTADRHAAAGMKCETCHKSGTPQPGAPEGEPDERISPPAQPVPSR